MEEMRQLILLAEEANRHYYNFLSNNNLKAAVRCRKVLNELRKAAQDSRLKILDRQKEIGFERYLKSVDRSDDRIRWHDGNTNQGKP